MTRKEAIYEMIYEVCNDRKSKTSYSRVCRAMNMLGYPRDDQMIWLQRLNYLDEAGLPLPWLSVALSKGAK